MYVEREGGEFKLRRGFHIEPGQKVVMVEDIVTTGLSSRECIAAIRRRAAMWSRRPVSSIARAAAPMSACR
jgi:orotate phosphoribosyltransferase